MTDRSGIFWFILVQIYLYLYPYLCIMNIQYIAENCLRWNTVCRNEMIVSLKRVRIIWYIYIWLYHVQPHVNSARNSQLLRQIGVGTVKILFDCPICLQVAGTCTTWTNLCTVQLESEISDTYIETRPADVLWPAQVLYRPICRLFRTVQTVPVSQLVHRDI